MMSNTECSNSNSVSAVEFSKAADPTTSNSPGNNYDKTSDEILLAEDINDAEELETTDDESDEASNFTFY